MTNPLVAEFHQSRPMPSHLRPQLSSLEGALGAIGVILTALLGIPVVVRMRRRTPQGGSGIAEVKNGHAETRCWPLVYARDLPGDKPWWVCWEDASGKIRDPVRVPDAYQRLLSTERTSAEKAGESA